MITRRWARFRLRAPRFGGLKPVRSSRSERRRVALPTLQHYKTLWLCLWERGRSKRGAAAEIGLAHPRILAQCGAGAADDDAAGLQHVAAARGLQGVARVLLHQQHAGAGRVDRPDGLEDVLHDERREAERGLVEDIFKTIRAINAA